MAELKQIQVQEKVRLLVQNLKKSLELNNASEVIAYLYTIYDSRYPNLTVIEDQKIREKTKQFLDVDE